MSDRGYMYWVVDGGTAAERLAELRRKQDQQREAVEFFKDKWEADGMVVSSSAISARHTGIIVESGACPSGWIHMQGEDETWFRPDRRTKIGKQAVIELTALPCISTSDVGRMLLGRDSVDTPSPRGPFSVYMHTASLETFGATDVISAVAHDEWEPVDGLRQIPDSEYWRLKEQHDGAAA